MKIETADGRTLYSKEENSTRLMIRRIFIYIVVIIICLIIGYFIFKQFRDMSDARMALREAKNIFMSLEMVDMEYYGLGLTIYDEKAAGSIRSGAAEKARRLQGDVKGEIRIGRFTGWKKY